VNARMLELVAVPLRAVRRATFWWALGLGALVAMTMAVWPAFKGSSGISQAMDQLPSGVVQAFGLQDFGTPAGFLRGNLYDFFVPLLLAAAAVMLVSGQTASEESAGRLELYLAQPVGRRAVLLGRIGAALLGLTLISVVLLIVQLASDAAVNLGIDTGFVVATVVLSTLLAVLHGSLAVAIAGIRPRPSLVLGVALGVAFAGLIVSSLFPLSSALAPWRHISPWDWAFGGNPLEQATDLWRYAALLLPSIVLTAIGVYSVTQRDVATG
jgi:beta-exotoxin I transport system permease protein